MEFAYFFTQFIPEMITYWTGSQLITGKDRLRENAEAIQDIKESLAYNTLSNAYGVKDSGVSHNTFIRSNLLGFSLDLLIEHWQEVKAFLLLQGVAVKATAEEIAEQFNEWFKGFRADLANTFDNMLANSAPTATSVAVTYPEKQKTTMKQLTKLIHELNLSQSVRVEGGGLEYDTTTEAGQVATLFDVLHNKGLIANASTSLTQWPIIYRDFENYPYMTVVYIKSVADSTFKFKQLTLLTSEPLTDLSITEIDEDDIRVNFGRALKTGQTCRAFLTDVSTGIQQGIEITDSNDDLLIGSNPFRTTTQDNVLMSAVSAIGVTYEVILLNSSTATDVTYTTDKDSLIGTAIVDDNYTAVTNDNIGTLVDTLPATVILNPSAVSDILTPTASVDTMTGVNVYPWDVTAERTITSTGTETKTRAEVQTAIDEAIEESGTSTGTPLVPIVDGDGANAMFTLYKLNNAKLNSLGQWLWSSSVLDALAKLFGDPIDSIISLTAYPVSVATDGHKYIKFGNVASTIDADVVDGYFQELDLGTINLAEYFNNFLDYAPYTKVSIYLPFVGIVDLNTDDVMGASINVKYRWEYITGACMAFITITRGNMTARFYQYSGLLGMSMPVTGSNYANLYKSIAGAIAGVGSAIATGGVTSGLAASSVANVIANKPTVQRAGSMNGNSGMLGSMKPYLIIERPVVNKPQGYADYKGLPCNQYVLISSLSGYVELDEVHITNMNITETEQTELEAIIKSGFEI